MGYVTAFIQLLKIFGKVLDLFMEKNKKKAEAKKKVMDEVIDAAKETNPKLRASRLNMALDNASRL